MFFEPRGEDEMEKAGLAPATSINVKPTRIEATPVALECKYLQTVKLPSQSSGANNRVVLGQVVGVYVDDKVITDGIIDIAKLRPFARLGYLNYSMVEPEAVFKMTRPD